MMQEDLAVPAHQVHFVQFMLGDHSLVHSRLTVHDPQWTHRLVVIRDWLQTIQRLRRRTGRTLSQTSSKLFDYIFLAWFTR